MFHRFCGRHDASRAIILLLFLALSLAACADVPRTITFQDTLTSRDGALQPDGSYPVVLRVYDVATGGSVLCTEVKNVAVTRGTFSATIFPVILSFDKPYRISVQANNDTEMSPRRPLASVPFAFSAHNAYDLVLPFSQTVTIDHVPAFTIQNDKSAASISIYEESASSIGYGFFGTNTSSGYVGLLGAQDLGISGEHEASGNYSTLGSATTGMHGHSSRGSGVYGTGSDSGVIGNSDGGKGVVGSSNTG